jgi:predicted N-formylglutamate amidohydrolase
VVDPERFLGDSQELMGQVGLSVICNAGSVRQSLRNQSTQSKHQELLERFYIPHHQRLTDAVEESLRVSHSCLIIDEHSFPAMVLPFELNQTVF